MFARIALFGIALLALWMIWRVVRQWIDANAARGGAEEDPREARRISHQRNDASNTSIAASASAGRDRSGVRRGDDPHDPDAARDVDAPRTGDHPSGGGTHGDGGSSGGGDLGGKSGGGRD